MSDFESPMDPPGFAGIRDALEDQAVLVRQWATKQIGEVEQKRDEELRRIDGALACLQDRRSRAPRRRSSSPAARAARSQRKPAATTPDAVRERCEAVARLLAEVARPLSPKEIRQMLNLTSHTVNTALKRLTREGRVKRTGDGPAARYAAIGAGSGVAAKPAGPSPGPGYRGGDGSNEGTLQGRILITLQDRGYASADELVQATGASRDEVVKECGVLLRQEEIHMERREGRSVFVYQAS
jgi:biotin operon repressor